MKVEVKENNATLEDFKDQLPPMEAQEFDDHMDTEQIKLLVYQLLSETDNNADDRKRSRKQYAELRGKYQVKFKGLMMRYPALYNMILENGKEFDLLQFEQMMGMIAKVRAKKMTEENASKEFGEKMVDKYVKSKITPK